MILIALRFVYLLALVACTAVVGRKGGRDERIGVAIVAIASVLTVPAQIRGYRLWWHSINIGLLAVDVAALLSCFLLAMRSDRFWPLYLAAFHIVAVLTSLVQSLHPEIRQHTYFVAAGFWAYPSMIALLVGVREFRVRMSDDAGTKSLGR